VPFGSGAGEVDLYIKPSVFRADVAADESPHAAAILAAQQRPLAATALQEKSTTPAWKTIPSWALIGTEDMVLPPAEQVFMTHRAHAKTTKVKAAHLSMVTHPSLVTKIILRAVAATR
jgi:pimeloyl-ACP methyl ester carboxylesterase